MKRHRLTSARTGRTRGIRCRGGVAHPRGNVLIEALVFMVVIAIAAAAFTVSATAGSKTQRSSASYDIASQASSGLLERAESLPWGDLGFADTDTGYTSSHDGRPTVRLTNPASPDDRIVPITETRIKGTDVEMVTHITWLSGPTSTGYGTKRITTEVTWNNGSGEQTSTFSVDRTSSPEEADPLDNRVNSVDVPLQEVVEPPRDASTDPEDLDPDGVGYDYDGFLGTSGPPDSDTPGCPIFSVVSNNDGARFRWLREGDDVSFQIVVDGAVQAAPGPGSTTYLFTGLTPGEHSFSMNAVRNGIVTSGCTSIGENIGDIVLPDCPTLTTVQGRPGGVRLAWTRDEKAQRYRIYLDNSAYQTVTETSTEIYGLTVGRHTVRVVGVNGVYESTGCGSAEFTVTPPAPTCPTVTAADMDANGTITVSFSPSDYATNYTVQIQTTSGNTSRSYSQAGTYQFFGYDNRGQHYARVTAGNSTGTSSGCANIAVTKPFLPSPTCPNWSVSPNSPNRSATVSVGTGQHVDTYTLSMDGSSATYYSGGFSRTYTNLNYGGHTASLSVYNSTSRESRSCGSQSFSIDSPTPQCPSWSMSGGKAQWTLNMGSGTNVGSYEFSSGDGFNQTYGGSTTVTRTGRSPGNYSASLTVFNTDRSKAASCGSRSYTVSPRDITCPSGISLSRYRDNPDVNRGIKATFNNLDSSYGNVTYIIRNQNGINLGAGGGSPVKTGPLNGTNYTVRLVVQNSSGSTACGSYETFTLK